MFHGSIVAIVTPMKINRDIDFEGLRRLAQMHVDSGTQAIVVGGSTGEAAMLSYDELRRMIRHVVEQVATNIPVIAGTGSSSTAKAIELTKMAMHEGVDACLLMTPAYVRPTQEGLFQHYNSIAHAAAIPQILYNVPARTACDLLPETIARLIGNPNIIGIKEACGDIARIQQILTLCEGELDIFSGEDHLGLASMKNGAKGVISVTANVAPAKMQQLCNDVLNGNIEAAEKLDEKLGLLHKALFCESNPIPLKWALHQMGWIEDGIRLPLTALSEQYHDRVRDALKQNELLN